MSSNDFKNNIKSIRTTSPDYYIFAGGNCPESCLDSFSQNIYQFAIESQLAVLLSSLTARNFNNRNLFMSFYEKSLPKYLVNENSKFEQFFISEKAAPKTDTFFNFLPYI